MKLEDLSSFICFFFLILENYMCYNERGQFLFFKDIQLFCFIILFLFSVNFVLSYRLWNILWMKSIIFHIFLQILNHLIWRHGGDSVLYKVLLLLEMQIPSARPNMLTIIGHFQTDIRNKKDKLQFYQIQFLFLLRFVLYFWQWYFKTGIQAQRL